MRVISGAIAGMYRKSAVYFHPVCWCRLSSCSGLKNWLENAKQGMRKSLQWHPILLSCFSIKSSGAHVNQLLSGPFYRGLARGEPVGGRTEREDRNEIFVTRCGGDIQHFKTRKKRQESLMSCEQKNLLRNGRCVKRHEIGNWVEI